MSAASRASRLHRAGPDDIDVLLPLIAEFCAADDHPYDAARLDRALPPLLDSDAYGVVWLVGDGPAGYAVITWSYSLESGGPDALLDEFYLRERRTGLGSRVLAAILDDLRTRGIPRIFLETEAANAAARRFYARHGFVTEQSVWMCADL